MTPEEFKMRLEKNIDQILKTDKPLNFGVRSVMALQSKRIFIEGKNASGGLIGEYGKNPIYVSEKSRLKTNLPSFELKGKYGDTKFENGEPHKSGYFESYYDFKKAIGRNKNISSVDLFLTGELHRHWANSDDLTKAEARKVNQHYYYVAISNTDAKKVEKYGNVFGLTKEEKETFYKVVTKELIKILK